MTPMRILPVLALAVTVLAAVTSASCSEERRTYVRNIGDGDTTPTLSTRDVRTFVSDSGYTRFFIESDIWDMYEDAVEPYWYFPEGLHLQEYDRDMHVIATVVCDTARYLSQKRLWRLRGHVVMVNTEGDSFLTQLMYWDQNRREVYSDSFIHIVRQGRVIEGYGFRSNENITEYTILNPTGIIPRADIADNESDPLPDSVLDERRSRRPIPRRQSIGHPVMMGENP